uniref:Organ specific protein n=1 Tax=Caenorhabditis tropicalis TaxID=1561998 RepID=A0A1I7TAZ3_9PELO
MKSFIFSLLLITISLYFNRIAKNPMMSPAVFETFATALEDSIHDSQSHQPTHHTEKYSWKNSGSSPKPNSPTTDWKITAEKNQMMDLVTFETFATALEDNIHDSQSHQPTHHTEKYSWKNSGSSPKPNSPTTDWKITVEAHQSSVSVQMHDFNALGSTSLPHFGNRCLPHRLHLTASGAIDEP